MGKTKDNTGRGEPEHSGNEAGDRDTLADAEPVHLDLSRTIPTGAAFHATWKMPAVKPASAPPGATGSGNNDSGVRRLDIPAEDSHAKHSFKGNQTLISMVPGAAMPSATPSATPSPVPSASPSHPAPDLSNIPHDSLGRTLRMEIGISSHPPAGSSPSGAPLGQHNEPRDTLEPAVPSAAVSATRKAAFSRNNENVIAATVARVGESADAERTSTRPASFRSTDPFGNPSVDRAPVETLKVTPSQRAEAVAEAVSHSDRAPKSSDRPAATSDRAPRLEADNEVHVEPKADGRKKSDRPRAQRAYAEQRLGVTAAREYLRAQPAAAGGSSLGSSNMITIGLVASAVVAVAFGIFMFFMRPASEETIDPITDATTGAAPHVVTPAPLAGAKPTNTAAAAAPAAATPAPNLAPAANSTIIASNPSAAEVVLGGAVVANTPLRVTHLSYDVDYLVRLPGYEPQLLRIGPKSPQQITVQLTATKPEAQK